MRSRVLELREALGITQEEFAARCGISRTSIARYERGEPVNRINAEKIAKACGCSVDYVIGTALKPVIDIKNTGIKIPVLGSIHAGIPIVAIEEVEDWEEIPEALARTGEYIALRVSGDSMTPEIRNGDVAIIRRQEDIESGQIAAVLVNGEEATLKQIKKTAQGIVLVGLNPAVYAPHLYTWDEVGALPVRIYGKLVEVRRKY